MAFNWFRSNQQINQLIAKQKYPQAAAQLEKILQKEPDNILLIKQLGDLLPKAGRTEEGLAYMAKVADSYIEEGFFMKALAQLKKMKRLAPYDEDLQKKIDGLIEEEKGPTNDPYKTVDFEAPEPVEEAIEPAEETEASQLGKRPIQSPLFDGFTTEELKGFIDGMELKTFEPGDILCTEGEPGDSLMVLANGVLKVFVANLAGRSEEVRILREGDFFGEISLLSRKPRTATITCATDCELLELNRKKLIELSKNHPEIPKTLKKFYQERALSAEEMDARCGE